MSGCASPSDSADERQVPPTQFSLTAAGGIGRVELHCGVALLAAQKCPSSRYGAESKDLNEFTCEGLRNGTGSCQNAIRWVATVRPFKDESNATLRIRDSRGQITGYCRCQGTGACVVESTSMQAFNYSAADTEVDVLVRAEFLVDGWPSMHNEEFEARVAYGGEFTLFLGARP